jgi:hypothetical protein
LKSAFFRQVIAALQPTKPGGPAALEGLYRCREADLPFGAVDAAHNHRPAIPYRNGRCNHRHRRSRLGDPPAAERPRLGDVNGAVSWFEPNAPNHYVQSDTACSKRFHLTWWCGFIEFIDEIAILGQAHNLKVTGSNPVPATNFL